MWDKEAKRLKIAVRRGIALGLALAGLWAASLTADPAAIPAALTELSERPGLGVNLLSAELGYHKPEEKGHILTGFRRLLLQSSAPLAAAEGLIAALREENLSPSPVEIVEDTGENEPEIVTPPEAVENTIDRTATPGEGVGWLSGAGVHLYNRSGLEFDPESVTAKAPPLSADGPQILILHTHGSEAYTPTADSPYEASGAEDWSSNRRNPVRICPFSSVL